MAVPHKALAPYPQTHSISGCLVGDYRNGYLGHPIDLYGSGKTSCFYETLPQRSASCQPKNATLHPLNGLFQDKLAPER